VALAVIDALDRELAPLDKQLGSYARRQPGCKALMVHYGIGKLTAVTILAELGDPSASPPREKLSVSLDWTSPCTPPINGARPATCLARGRQRCAGRCSKPPSARAGPTHPTTITTFRRRGDSGGNRACLAVAHKLLKRSYHTLRQLGEQALQPA